VFDELFVRKFIGFRKSFLFFYFFHWCLMKYSSCLMKYTKFTFILFDEIFARCTAVRFFFFFLGSFVSMFLGSICLMKFS
jgi:hypothetical protein